MTSDLLPKFHTVDVWINDEGPFTAVSELRGGLGVSLYTAPDGFIHLGVRFELDQNTTKTYRLKSLRPGDRIKLAYDGPNDDSGSSIDEIEKLERDEPPPELPERHRFGFDVKRSSGETIRLSHPPDGHLGLVLMNVPLDHARLWDNASNDDEQWNWQLDDLYAGDSLKFEIVATDWCDEFPNVTKQPK